MPIRGVSKDGFVEPRQPDADLGLYNQYYYNDFVFNPARMELNSIQLNSYFEKACCSSLYEVFYVKRLDVVLPEYLNLLLKRREFARWCEYVGWGSAREYCRVDTISQYPIVVPSIEEQKSVVGIYKAYMLRRQINEQLKAQIKDICPILIRGSLEEVK
jgi:type I restriction enzyme S subunit